MRIAGAIRGMSHRTLAPDLQALGLLRNEQQPKPPTAPTAMPERQRLPGYISTRAGAPEAPRASTQTVHQRRLADLLVLLARFGHLRAHEVATAMFGPAQCGRQLAQRLLRAAAKSGLVLPRKNALGGLSWVLAERGVAQLELHGYQARHGRDIVGVAGATFIHRTLATQYLLHRARKKASVFGEYGIAHQLAPISREAMSARFHKLADGLVVYGTDRGLAVDVVEVEASSKPMAELVNVLGWAEVVGTPLNGAGSPTIARLVVAFDGSQGHAKRLLRAARERWGHCGPAEFQAAMRRVVLASARVGPGQTWQGCEEQTLAAWAASAKQSKAGCYTNQEPTATPSRPLHEF